MNQPERERTERKCAIQRKVAALLLGLLFALVLLEIGLRVSGALFVWTQNRRNRRALEEGGDFVVLCLGESTTALSDPLASPPSPAYPRLLEEVLNERVGESRFTVINGGIAAADTSLILARLEPALDKYQPRIVVAMMGANDGSGGAIPWAGTPVAERTGFPYSLRVYKLVELMAHQYLSDKTGLPGKPGFHTGDKPPPPSPPGKTREGKPRGRSEPVPGPHGSPAQARLTLQRCLAADQAAARGDRAEATRIRRAAGQPDCGEAFFQHARQLEETGEAGQAAAFYRKAVETAPGRAFYAHQFANFMLIEEHLEEAEKLARRALEADPLDEVSHVVLGRTLDRLGRRDEAEEHLVRAYEMARAAHTPDRMHRVIKALTEFWDRHDMDPNLEIAPEDVPDDEFLLGRMARFHEQRGRPELAEEYLARVARLLVRRFNPKTRENYRRLQTILAERNITLVAVQYPGRPLRALARLFRQREGVYFVDNERTFREAVAKRGYEAIFLDHCYGDFGHASREGNTILANNVAEVILGEVLGLKSK